MIENERQYVFTLSQIKKLKNELESIKTHSEGIHPILYKAQKDSIKSLISELEGQIHEYKELKQNKK